MKVREPVERPLDVVIVELLLSASQAYVSGLLMYLAVGLWTDRGVGLGPVAVILAVLSLAVGAAWLFWLLGGNGWPLAATNVPVAMFAGFALVLGTQGDGLIRLEPLPLMLLIATSVYGIIGGVFLDSPRRWRWNQRRTLRPGTKVPRVSPTTTALAARIPRTLPARRTGTEPGWPEPPTPGAPPGDGSVAASSASATADAVESHTQDPRSDPLSDTANSGILAPPGETDSSPSSAGLDAAPSAAAPEPGTPLALDAARDPKATPGLASAPGPVAAPPGAPAAGAIELPTSIEPRPQRSPWAWAAPPEWSREDEDDDQPGAAPQDKS